LRFSRIVDDLSRLIAIERRATEISGGVIDPIISSDLAAVREDLIRQLQELIFPEPLSI
jgi:hypothetical protein